MSKRKIPVEKIVERLPDYITLDTSTYVNTATKARFIDAEYGDYWAVPQSIFRGHRHPGHTAAKTSQRCRKKLEEFIHLLPDYLSIDPATYEKFTAPALFIDRDYGEFWAKPNDIFDFKCHRDRAIAEGRQVTQTPEDLQKRLPSNLRLITSSYVGMGYKAKFVDDEYGEFETKPCSILSQGAGHPARTHAKRVETWKRNLGVDHPHRCSSVRSKAQRSMKKSCTLFRWSDGAEIGCIGSYEKTVVEWLNAHKIQFEWQIRFELPDGRYFFCDLFLPETNRYIEIKGWWQQEVSRMKWEWFHSTHPNSELWNLPKLQELGILKKPQRAYKPRKSKIQSCNDVSENPG